MVQSADSPLVRAHLRSTTRSTALALLAALLLGVPGAVVLTDTIRSALVVYEQVRVTATAEGTERVSMGRRANWQPRDVRTVTVTLLDGSERTMRSDDVEVGETVTAFRDTGSGTVHEEPDSPGLLAWAFSVGTIAAGVVFARNGLKGLRRLARVVRADLDRAPVVTLQVTRVRQDATGSKRVFTIDTLVAGSTDPRLPPGDAVTVTSPVAESPREIPAVLDARTVHSRRASALLALRTAGNAPWWIADGRLASPHTRPPATEN